MQDLSLGTVQYNRPAAKTPQTNRSNQHFTVHTDEKHPEVKTMGNTHANMGQYLCVEK